MDFFSKKTNDDLLIEAINLCVTNSNTGNNFLLAMDLINSYLQSTFSKQKLVTYLRTHLAAFLADEAVNAEGKTLLHLFAHANYNKATREDKQAVIDFTVLITKQYAHCLSLDRCAPYPLLNSDDKVYKTAGQIITEILAQDPGRGGIHYQFYKDFKNALTTQITNVTDEGKAESQENVSVKNNTLPTQIIESQALILEGIIDYSVPTNWNNKFKRKNSKTICAQIKDLILRTDKVSEAMSVIQGYFIHFKTPPEQLEMLCNMHASLHIFLRKDAKTPSGYTILHLLALCDLQDEYAARIMLILLKNFEHVKEMINIQANDSATALHIAIRNGLPQIVNVLVKHQADLTIKNGADENAKTAHELANSLKDKDKKLQINIMLDSKENIKLTIKSMPNLYNNLEDDGRALGGVIFRLLTIGWHSSAATALSAFLDNQAYPNKIIIINSYINRPGNQQLWDNFIEEDNAKDKSNRNLLAIFACGRYCDTEIKEAISLVVSIMDKLSQEKIIARINNQDTNKNMPVDNALLSESSHAPYFIQLYIRKYNDLLGSSQPKELTELIGLYKRLAKLDTDKTRKQNKLDALDDTFNLDKMLNITWYGFG
ncbi:MAG: ankyrin repeat domain-containing protein [Gammaproteobacteria bacterium]